MADETTPNNNTPEQQASEDKAAETKTQTENVVPKARFDEISQKYKETVSKLDELLAERTKAEKAAKAEQGKFEELYRTTSDELGALKDQQKASGERVTQLEAVITGLLEVKLEAIPEDFRDLVPGHLTPEAKLDWLTAAEKKGLFGANKRETPIGESTNPNSKQTVDLNKLSPMELLRAAYGAK